MAQTRQGASTVMTIADNFWDHVDIKAPGECWPWQRACRGGGYGECWRDYKHIAAHRLAYELTTGPIPDGLCCLHHCDNPPCCNPKHLWLGTMRDNAQDRARKNRSRQVHGSRNHMALLTWEEVRAIRARYTTGNVTQQELAKEYGVSRPSISNVVNRRTWN